MKTKAVIGGLAGGVFLMIVILAAIVGIGSPGSQPGAVGPVQDAGVGDPVQEGVYTLTATGSGQMQISHSNGRGGLDSTTARDTWTTQVPDAEFMPPTLTVSAMDGTVTCKVTKGERVVKESVGDGEFPMAMC